MTVLTASFDPIEYAKQLRTVGVSQDQADVQAQTMERVINDIATNQNLVTKQDLARNLAELKFELIKWMLGIGVGGVVAIAGLLQYTH